MKAIQSTILAATCLCFPPSSSVASAPKPETQSLLDANPGMRAMFSGDELIALYGVPFATDNDPSTDSNQFIQAFLAVHDEALGVDDVSLVLADKINIRDDKFTIYTYTQLLEGLPVHGTVVKIPVLLGAMERIGYVGVHLIQPPQTPLPTDLITANDAIVVVAQSTSYGHLTGFTAPEKTIFEAIDGGLHRAWRFGGYGNAEAHRFFVDTNSGELVGIQELTMHSDVSGTVTGYATPCCAPSDPENPFCPDSPDACPAEDPGICSDPHEDCLTFDPRDSCCCGADDPDNPCTPSPMSLTLPGVRVSVYADIPPNCADADPEAGTLVAQTYTNANGDYSFSGITPPVRVVSRLSSERITVINCGGSDGCVGDELLACAEVSTDPAGPVDLTFNAVSEGYNTSQVNAMAVASATHEWFAALQPTFTAIEQPIEIRVNHNSVPAGLYLPFLHRILLGGDEQTSPNNAAFSTVVSHEYGHFLVTELIVYRHDSTFQEGAADTIASLMWSTACLGFGLSPLTGENVGCASNADEPDIDWHTGRLALTGAVWDTRKNLIETFSNDPDPEASAKAIIDALFADFLFVSDGELDESIIVEMLIVDDDDADLRNGTPHETEILNGFALHAWVAPMACDTQETVSVEWEGPPGVPVEGVDYVVHCEVDPPNITLLTTEQELIPVVRWRIGRALGGSHNLGVVTANWATPSTHDIVVEVGTIPIAPCANVNIVHIPAQSGDNWSSIVLELGGDLRVRALCDPVTQEGASLGNGGRISGWIGGDAGILIAEAIGTDEASPGNLTVSRTLDDATLGTVPSGSLLSAANLMRPLTITGEMNGTIDIDTVRYIRHVNVSLEHGGIHVQGLGLSDGNITVSKTLAGADIIIEGPFAGAITVAQSEQTVSPIGGYTREPLIQTGDLTGTIAVSTLTAGTIEIGTLQAGAFVGASGLINVGTFLADDARIVVHGDVAKTGRVSVLGGSIGADASIEIEGDFNGSLNIGTRLKTPPGIVADIAGQVIIGGSLSGSFDHHGRLEQGGEIIIDSDITKGGTYSQTIDDPENQWAGALRVAGDVLGNIGLESDVSYGVITVGAYLEGGIELDQSLVGGGLHVGEDLGGRIAIDGSVLSGGGIYVDGRLGKGSISVGNMSSGIISIGEDTEVSSLIHLGGFNSGRIEINAKEGNFDANGDILVGAFKVPLKLPDIAFDGCVRVFDDGAGNGGTLNGNITVVGCLDPQLLNICVDGPIKGDIIIHQDNCPPPPVGWLCLFCGGP